MGETCQNIEGFEWVKEDHKCKVSCPPGTYWRICKSAPACTYVYSQCKVSCRTLDKDICEKTSEDCVWAEETSGCEERKVSCPTDQDTNQTTCHQDNPGCVWGDEQCKVWCEKLGEETCKQPPGCGWARDKQCKAEPLHCSDLHQ